MFDATHHRFRPQRRKALGTLAAFGGAAALSACATTPQPEAAPTPKAALPEIDFRDPRQNLNAFVKMLGDTDPDKVAVSWFGGDIFANPGDDQKLVPLIGVNGFGVLRIEPQPDNKYRLFNREFAAYSDPRTRQIIDEWDNPYTGERVEVSPIHNAVVNAEVAPTFTMDLDGTEVEMPFLPPWWEMGDTLFNVFEVHAAFPSPMQPDQWPRESAGPVARVSEIFQRSTSLAQLADPSLTSAHYEGTWNRLGPWLPWMLMGQKPGHLYYRTFMKKLGGVDELPPDLVAYVEKGYPEFFEAPGPETWGGPNDSSFTVYMRENEPKPPKE